MDGEVCSGQLPIYSGVKHEYLHEKRQSTSAFRIPKTRSLDDGPRPSISTRLSNVQTDTRLCVTLCVAPCTFHKPILTVGACDTGVEDPEGVGVPDLLMLVVPML